MSTQEPQPRPDQPTIPPADGTVVTKLKVPGTDQPTVVADLSTSAGDPAATVVTDLGGGARPPSGSGITRIPTSADQPTLATAPPNRRTDIGTQVTDLNVNNPGAAKADSGVGTHGNQVWGDFAIGGLLGKGGMGSVYKGRQVSLDRPVAIKVLPPHLSENDNFRARFGLEAKAVALINSPHVIQVYGAGQHAGHHYFAMEYVEGTDLAVKLKGGWRPTYREALDLVAQACRGLAAAGELGIIHRDIKPANMMMTKKGVLKLMDFGLAKLAASGDTGLTMAGTIMGTVNYFSPEQGRGEVCDQRTDIYALGVVFYEMLTGRLPFTGQDATSIIYQHIHQAPRAPKEIDPQIPEDYQAVVLKCMQKRADDRYQTAGDLLRDLEALAQGQAPQSAYLDPSAIRSGGTVVKSGQFAREKTGGGTGGSKAPLLIAGAALLVAAVIGAAVMMTRGPAPDAKPVERIVQPLPTRFDPLSLRTGPDPAETAAVMAEVRDLLAKGSFEAAQRQAEAQARTYSDSEEWKRVLGEIHRAHGENLLKQAETAFAAGDAERAGRAAAEAQGLISDSLPLKSLVTRITSREGVAKQRQRVLDEARSAIGEGKPAKAEETLAVLAASLPDDEEVAKELRLARTQREQTDARAQAVREQLANGERALERKDWDGAQLSFTAALQHDPGSTRASSGLAAVNKVKETIAALRDRFSAALRARDLVAAEATLADLRATAPGSAAVVLAEAEMTNSKLVEDEQKKRQAELETRMSAQARGVLTIIEDPKSEVPAMEHALTQFLASAGVNRPEKPELERRIEDRRQLKRIETNLGTLDKAVTAGDAVALATVVVDQPFAAALAALHRYDGLVFSTRVDDFARDGKQGTLKVSIRHALAVYPERVLHYVLSLREESAGWVIAGAQLQQP